MQMARSLAFFMLAILLVSELAAQPSGSQQFTAQPTLENVPTRELVLKTFVDADDLRKNTKSRLEAVRDQIKHRLEAEGPANPELLKIADDTFGTMIENLPLDDLIETMVRFAQQHFTEVDLQAIAAFHGSPMGHSVDAKLKEMGPIVARASDPQQEKILAASPLAKDAPTEDDVAKLLDVMQSRKTTLAMARAFNQQSGANDVEEAKYLDHAMRVTALVYRHYYTAAEVKFLITFFSSTAGQKLLAGAPDLSAEMAKAMAPTMKKLSETLRDRVTEYYRQHGSQR